MRVRQFIDGLGFKYNLTPDDKIREVGVQQSYSLIGNIESLLSSKGDLSLIQFHDEGILVEDFVVAFAQSTMNLHTQTDQPVGFIPVKQFRHLKSVRISEIRVSAITHHLATPGGVETAFALFVGLGGIEVIPLVGKIVLPEILLHLRIRPVEHRTDL